MSTFLPLVFFVLFQKFDKKRELKVILFYLAYCAFNDILTYYLFQVAHIKAFIIYDIFTIAELAFFMAFFSRIVKSKTIRKYLPLIFSAYIAFCLIDYAFIRQDRSFNSAMPSVQELIIIIFCLLYFYEQLKEAETLLIYATQNFWFIIGFLIFSSGTFILYVYTETMVKDENFLYQYVIINSSFMLLKNILFTIGMLIKPQKEEPPSVPEESLESDWTKVNL